MNTKKVGFFLRDEAIPFYYEISKGLTQIGIEVFWLTINKGWYEYLKDRVDHDHLCYIPSHFDKIDHDDDESIISDLEKMYPHFNLSKWILSDRGLVGRDYESCKCMLIHFSTRLKKFLQESQINYLLGEMTFSVELMAYHLCRTMDVRYLYPDTVKIPSDRFAFFETPYYGMEFMRAHYTQQHIDDAKKLYESWVVNKIKPHFYLLHRNKPKPNFAWVKKYCRWSGETDYISSNTTQLAKNKIREVVNYLYLNSIHFHKVGDLTSNHRYVIYPLHKQPEASVDITAPEFSNQIATIENIARSLPYNYYLLVKEHTNALGCRGHDFYKHVKRIKNVILIDAYEDNFSVLERCDMVLTVAGTMGYEAALLGKPVIVFSKVFYGELSNVSYCACPADLNIMIKQALYSADKSHFDAIPFLAKLLANSYHGTKGNPKIHKNMMLPDHIQGWVSAFYEYINV